MSPSNAQQEDQAYILHTRPYKNTSMLVEAFCQQHGRLSFVVKGAKRKNSPMQGLIQAFTSLYIVWGGQGELKNLYKAEAISPHLSLNGDDLFAGFYINELIMYLLHKYDAHPELFLYYQQCLISLSEHQDIERSLRYFELDLINELGYGVNFQLDGHSGEEVSKERLYQYDFEIGVSEYRGDDPSVLHISGDTLHALAKRNLSTPAQKSEAKRLLRRILEYYLDGRPIRAREFFQQKNKITLSP